MINGISSCWPGFNFRLRQRAEAVLEFLLLTARMKANGRLKKKVP
jgi:hypothetical protein